MLKKLIRKLLFREKADSASYVQWLKDKGVEIGHDVSIFAPKSNVIDVTRPCLLSIGDHVRITEGVIILTHDYSWSVLKQLPESKGRVLGAQSPVVIGNNVFIGMNAIITRGVTIGNNVVIGAGSVVTKDCESDSVYAGNPARKIMTISEYLHKREALQFEEARKLAKIYREKYGKLPPREIFGEYFMLFCPLEEAGNNPVFRAQMATGRNYEDSDSYMRTHTPMFESYEAFLNACYDE